MGKWFKQCVNGMLLIAGIKKPSEIEGISIRSNNWLFYFDDLLFDGIVVL
jgi:hypothetical protein